MHSAPMADELLGSQGLDLATALTLLPSLLIVFFTPTYVYHHSRLIITRRGNVGSWLKLGLASTLFCMEAQVCLLPQPIEAGLVQVFASCVYLGFLCVVLALYVEHQNIFKGPGLLAACFAVNLLFDASKAYVMLTLQGSIDSVLIALICQKAFIVLLESGVRIAENNSPGLPRDGRKQNHFRAPIAATRVEDLPELEEELRPEQLYFQLKQAWETVDHGDTNCLWKAFYLAFPQLTLGTLFSRTCLTIAMFSQPVLMRYMIRVAEMEDVSLNASTSLLAMTALVYGGMALSKSYTSYTISRLSLSLRGAVGTHILQKTMRLKSDSPESSAAIATLGDDTTVMDRHVRLVFSIYGDINDSVAGLALLVVLVGMAGLMSVVPLIILIVIAKQRTANTRLLRANYRVTNNRRIAALSRFLPFLKDIKVTGLEPVLISFIRRVQSIDLQARDAYLSHWVSGHILLGICELCVPVITLASSLASERYSDELTATATFPPLAVATLLILPMMGLPQNFLHLSPVFASVQTIRDFLLLEEHVDNRLTGTATTSTALEHLNASRTELQNDETFLTGPFVCLFFSHLSVYSISDKKYILNDISGFILASQLNMVIGPVACGKSVLLSVLLGEVEAIRGAVQLRKRYRVAYCGQMPWIPNTTIRKCIVGVYDFDAAWYSKVIRACDLDLDFLQLTDGDQSMTGSGGSLLSGGQKQRVALARAVYSESDVLLLDDTFSSLDRITSRRIFMRLFGKDGLVKQAKITTIMSTHSVEYLPEADHIMAFGTDGTLKAYNDFFDLEVNSAAVAALRHSENFATDESNWQHLQLQPHNFTANPNLVTSERTNAPSMLVTSDWLVAKFFIQLIPTHTLVSHCIFTALTVIIEQFPGVYARFWIENEPQESWYLIGYLVMLCVHPVVHLGMYKHHQEMVIKARAGLSTELCNAMARANVGAITKLDSGFLLGRFFDDSATAQAIADDILKLWAFCLFNLADFATMVLASIFFLLSAPFFIICGILLLQPYQRACQKLIRLEVSTKTSIYTHVMEMTAGLYHIRALQWQEGYLRDVFQKLHAWQKVSYYQWAAERWFMLGLELIVFAAAMLIATLAIHSTSSNSSPASIALAVFILMRLSSKLGTFATAWNAYITNLSALSHSYKFIHSTPAELDLETMAQPLPAVWPSQGEVVVQNVSAGYGLLENEESSVIKDITFRLPSGHRIGIVGRTGCGKTSLALAILNSLSFNGTITIDGVDVSTIPPKELRRRITIVTQNPIELPGSVRDNIAPPDDNHPGEVDDGAMLEVLTKVGLLKHIEDRGGIDTPVTAMGFSQGQKQLLCLARAMIHNYTTKGRLVIIDEATSCMDYDTDSAMQQVMAEAFAGCTMVIIAHRVESLQGVDYLMELEAGEIVSLVPCSERASKAESKG